MNQRLQLPLMAALLALFCLPSRAQVFGKPTGQKAIPLRVGSLRAEVEIVGALAITHWEMTIQTESGWFGGSRNDGAVWDFICARPRDAKLTAFSSSGGNRGILLAGRVVEKSLAAPRVTFRAAPNDPLLKSGLNAGNSLRATIYPINSWGGITLRGTWVQILASSRNRSTYRLPLLALKGATTRLTSLNVKITVRDAALQNLSSNFNLPSQTQNGARVLTLGQKNYRVVRDLTVTVARKKAPLQSALMVAPNAAKDGGHFALAVIADRALKNPAFSLAGIESRDLTVPKSTRAGEVMLFTGVYAGDIAQLKARLSANGVARDVSASAVENPVARAVWATQKINALSVAAGANRAQIIALSKTYSVVSAFTSWLVVSDEDLKIYRRALVSSQLDPLVREYWIRVGYGQEKGARAVRLKKAIAQISRTNGLTLEDELYIRLGSAYGYVVWQKYGNYGNTKANKIGVEKRLARLSEKMLRYVSEKTAKKVGRSIDWASPLYGGELYDLRTQIMGEYRKPHPDYERLKTWEHRFAQLYGSTELDPRLRLWRARITAQELEAQTTLAEQAGDQTKLAALEKARRANSRNAYFVNNIGDPPIYVSAPADSRQVIAVMPDGSIKTLEYNALQKRWEGNYDVPVGTKEGEYRIEIVIVAGNGTRRRYAMPFRVDTTPPSGRGEVVRMPQSTPNEKSLRLEIQHGGDVARVTALLPWGEKVSLLPSTTQGNLFFAVVRAPREYDGKAIGVTYILVDRAHNLTTIEAESGAVSP